MTRGLLFAICLCLSLAAAPAALAEDDETAPPDEVVCSAEFGSEDDAEDPAGDEKDLDELGDYEDCEPEDDEGDLDEGDDVEELGEEEADEAPVFELGFLRRSLRLGGAGTGFTAGVLTVTVSSAPRVPAHLREQAAQLSGRELAVVVGRRTKLSRSRAVRGAKRRGGRRASPGALRRARRVKVEGKLLPPGRWRRDAEGRQVPTLRATRVTIVS